MRILVYGGIIYVVIVAGMSLVQRLEGTVADVYNRDDRMAAVLSGGNGAVLALIANRQWVSGLETVLWAVFAGCLLFACLTDVRTCYVYQFTWWMAGATGGLLLWTSELWTPERMLALFLYILLQELFFCRFYGRADCHAFAVCSVALCALGMGMFEYLMHMLLAFAGLSVVQALGGNINRKGGLKCPVAFLPYITFSFWLLLFF